MPLNQKVITLVFACIAALSAGTNYVFSAYAPQLAARLHLNSKQTNLVGAAGNAGVYLSGPLLGILVDKKGPRLSLLIAAATLFLGYGVLRLMYNGGPQGLFANFGRLALAELATGIGSSAALSSSVNGVSKSFSSKRRGSAMATVVSCFGLSAFAYSTISHAGFISGPDHTSSFLLILAWGCGISMLLGAIFVRPTLHALPSRGRAGGYHPIDDREGSPLDRTRTGSSPSGQHVPEFRLGAGEVEERDVDADPYDEEERRIRSQSKEKELAAADLDIKGWALLATPDFWLMFLYLGLCSGIGLMYINNLGTVVATFLLEGDPHDVATVQAFLVSLLSICNCLGRLAAGFASDWFAHHCPTNLRFARIWWFVPTATLFVLSQLLAAAADDADALFVPTALTGFAYGALFATSPVVCLERFGIHSFSTNNGLLTLAPSVFGNFANLIFGLIYDSNVDWSHDPHPPESTLTLARRAGGTVEHLCVSGRECFATAFHTTSVMSLCAVGVAFALARRRSMQFG